MAKTKTIKEKIDEELHQWAYRVANQIKDNFQKMKIGHSGDLLRSIYWQVHSAAKGDQQRIDFFYLHYGSFVEAGVGRGVKKWYVPEMKKLEIIESETSSRTAKPFFRSTINFHTRWLAERLADEYGKLGGLAIIQGLDAGLLKKSDTPTNGLDFTDDEL